MASISIYNTAILSHSMFLPSGRIILNILMCAFRRYSLHTQPRQDVTTGKLHPIITDAVAEFSGISYGTYVKFDS